LSFGIGIVDPVDDVRISNPATNPELLDALAAKFIEYDYDFRRIVRDICTSQTYQRSSQSTESNAHDELNFTRARIRRIRSELLLDCISEATETQDKFRGLPQGAKAVQIADGATTTYFLTTFGRAQRQSVCTCEVRGEPTLSQALHLINGNTVHNKIRSGGLVKKLLEAKKTPAEITEHLYVRCLSRKPTSEEAERLAALVAQAESVEQGLEDVFWAVLNSREFLFNH